MDTSNLADWIAELPPEVIGALGGSGLGGLYGLSRNFLSDEEDKDHILNNLLHGGLIGASGGLTYRGLKGLTSLGTGDTTSSRPLGSESGADDPLLDNSSPVERQARHLKALQGLSTESEGIGSQLRNESPPRSMPPFGRSTPPEDLGSLLRNEPPPRNITPFGGPSPPSDPNMDLIRSFRSEYKP